MTEINEIRTELHSYANPEHAEVARRFFKTGKGEYGEGDVFIGVRVPAVRRIARKYKKTNLGNVQLFMTSDIHEERLLALVILTLKFRKGAENEKEEIYNFYCSHLEYINNWDLIDISAMYIMGAYLEHRNRDILYELAKSDNLWYRRIAIMSTFWFIKNNDYKDTLAIAELLLNDTEDLIHKATGWMLRETGNRHREVEEAFLRKHYQEMPRTMLRYAIEKFPKELRHKYLKGMI